MTVCRAGWLALVLLTSACARDETLSAYGAAGETWVLQEIDDEPFDDHATLNFPQPGGLVAQTDCATFNARIEVPYPWFDLGPIAVTHRTCTQNAVEKRYLAALAEMSLSKVLGDVLLLSTPEGRSMVFTAAARKPR